MRFSPADLRRCRFAVSPAFETLSAIRVLTGPQPPGPHTDWLARARARTDVADLDLSPISLLQPRYGYTPDFLAPPPDSPSEDFGTELSRIAATPTEQVRDEINRALAETPGAFDSPAGRRLHADPAAALELITGLIARAWQLLVEPVWPKVRGLIDADIGFQTRRLADGGLDRLFAELHPSVHWRDNVLTRGRGDDEHRDLHGEGLLLIPSAFKWDQVVVVLDAPWRPALIYPARGLGNLWRSRGAEGSPALARLMGRTRARLLSDLDEPASTTWLAHRFALAPATVSQHLIVLRDAGLVRGERARHEVRYRRTPLGDAILAG